MSQTMVAGTVGDYASRNFRAVLVVEKYGIDFHDEADLPLEQACQARGLDFGFVRAELEAAGEPRRAAEGDWGGISLRKLIEHIIARHHEYLKLEMPRLRSRLDRMATKHGERDERLLARLHPVYCELQAELEMHLHKEEFILFPVIESYDRARESGRRVGPPPFGTVANPVAMMEHEHVRAKELLAEMRKITRDYVPADYACANFRGVFQSLAEMEADIHEHIRLENDFLHPRAKVLEQELLVS